MNNKLKIFISISAIGAIIVHAICPNIKIDSITLGLFIIAILPWITSIIESAKFPGGWEIKFRDLKEAAEKISPKEELAEELDESLSFVKIAEYDPNIALVALRIEIEKRLRELAKLAKIENFRMPLSKLLRELQRKEILTSSVFSGLQEIIMAGNQAAHGAKVEPTIADWAFTYGPKILAALDEIIQKYKEKFPNESLQRTGVTAGR